MIGKFTDWVFTNTNILDEAQAIFNNAHKAPRVTLDNVNDLNLMFIDIPIDVYKNVVKYVFKRFENTNPISSIGIPDTMRKGFIGRKAPIIFYITTQNELNSSARLSMCTQLNVFKAPVQLGSSKYYLWTCDPDNHDCNKFKVVDYTDTKDDSLTKFEKDENKGTPSNSRFYLGIYEKIDNKTLALKQTIVYKIEVDKSSTVTQGRKIITSGIHDATQILTEVFNGAEEGVIRKSDVNGFVGKFDAIIDKYFDNKVISGAEQQFWKSIFNVKLTNKKAIKTTDLYKDVKINGEPLLQFMAKSNYGIIASEILIPFYLVQGVTTINGVNLVDIITNNSKSPVKKVIWPLSQNEKYIDYSISFVETEDGERYGISAKAGTSTHKPPLITLLKDVNLDNYDLSKYKDADVQMVSDLISIVNQYVNEPKPSRARLTWFLGDYIKKRDTKRFTRLGKLFDDLNAGTYDCSQNKDNDALVAFISTLNKRYNRLFDAETLKEFCNPNGKYSRCFPYSITSFFEMQLNDYINSNVEIRKIIEDIRFSDPVHNYAQVKLLPNKTQGFTLSVLPPSTQKHESKGNWKATIGSSNGSTEKAITDKDLSNDKMIKLVCLNSKIKQFSFCNFDKCK